MGTQKICQTLANFWRGREHEEPEMPRATKANTHCSICMHDVSLVLRTPCCKTTWCDGCLQLWLQTAVDELQNTVQKIRCCRKALPVVLAASVFPQLTQDVERYRQKVTELDIPFLDRTYCFQCGKFIPIASHYGPEALCRNCGKETCVRCKEQVHRQHRKCESFELAHRIAAQQEESRQPSIKRCPHCYRRIVRDGGCKEVSCLCGKTFCWFCKQQGGCQCNMFDPTEAMEALEFARNADYIVAGIDPASLVFRLVTIPSFVTDIHDYLSTDPGLNEHLNAVAADLRDFEGINRSECGHMVFHEVPRVILPCMRCHHWQDTRVLHRCFTCAWEICGHCRIQLDF